MLWGFWQRTNVCTHIRKTKLCCSFEHQNSLCLVRISAATVCLLAQQPGDGRSLPLLLLLLPGLGSREASLQDAPSHNGTYASSLVLYLLLLYAVCAAASCFLGRLPNCSGLIRQSCCMSFNLRQGGCLRIGGNVYP